MRGIDLRVSKYVGMNARTTETVGVEDMLRCNSDVQSSDNDVVDAREYVRHRANNLFLCSFVKVCFDTESFPI